MVGNVEEGILAAEWSPDDSMLVLATGTLPILLRFILLTLFSGDRKLILMTNTFDVLSENPLEHETFGEGMARAPALPSSTHTYSLRRANKRRMGFQADTIPRLTRQGRRTGPKTSRHRVKSRRRRNPADKLARGRRVLRRVFAFADTKR